MKTTIQFINSLIVTGVTLYLSSCAPTVNYECQVYIPSNEEKGEILREDLAVYGDVYLCVFKVGNPYNATDNYLVSYNKKGKLIDGMNLGFGCDFSSEEDPEVQHVDYRLVSDRVVRVWNKITVGEHFNRTEENRIFIDASGKFHVRATEVCEERKIDDIHECQNRFFWKMYELSRIPLSDSTAFDQWNHLGDAEGVYADDLSIAIHSLYLRNPESYFKWMLRVRERDSLTAFLVPEDSLLQRDILNRANSIKDKESREYILNKLRKEIMVFHNGEQGQ